MRMIINADDLGRSEEVNDAIFAMMARGSVTSATILANGPQLQAALKKLSYFPHCSFGVHLSADEFAPLSNPVPLASLVDASGMFIPKRVRQVRPNRQLLAVLATEFSCQIEKLLSSGVHLSHIDSHHHVHTIPWLFPALKYVQRHYGIRRVRISRNIFSPTDRLSFFHSLQKNLYNFILRRVYETITVAGFTDLVTFAGMTNTLAVYPDTVELVVHPGSQTGGQENELLDVIAHDGLPWPGKLINYSQL